MTSLIPIKREPVDLGELTGLVLPAVRLLLADTGRVVALVKPQFEAGKEDVPRGGVVTDPAVWERVLRQVASAAEEAGLHSHRAIRSPITGTDGNVEFLADLRSDPADGHAFELSVVEATRG